jgi:beta-carotene hydroxylase
MSQTESIAAGDIVTDSPPRESQRMSAETLAKARAFETVARNVLKPLSGRMAWRTVGFFYADLAAIAAVDAVTLAGVLPYWAAVPINAFLIYLIFTPLHEAVHENILPRDATARWPEALIGHISGFVLLAPYPGFRALHLHHHQHTNDPMEDPDYWVRSNNYLMVILRCMAIQPVYIWHLWKIARTPVIMRAFIEEAIYLAAYAAIIAGAYALGHGNELILLWILPGYIGVVMCPLIFDWPVHHPHTERGRYTDSAILLFPKPIRPLMDFIFCGHAYHLMHHMYPRIPFYDYGTAYYALQHELASVGATVRDFSRKRA